MIEKPSKYQQAIFDWIQTGEGSAIIEAVAGSGKTSTIVHALSLVPSSQRALFMAFNKSIADELKRKVPANAVASTFHSAGFRAWTRRHPSCQVEDRKVLKLVKESLTYWEMETFGLFVRDLVGFAKQRGIGAIMPDTDAAWLDIIDHFDLRVNGADDPLGEDDLQSQAIEEARCILKASNDQSSKVVDFNDMLYMPLLERLPLDQFPFVFIDEGQDTNSVRRELAGKMLEPGGRLVAVGDSHQAIYGFTGADSDALEQIRQKFNAQTFPLSVCYRSGRAIVSTAKRFVPAIEPKEDAELGIVADTSFEERSPGVNDAIICRNTAPLVELAYEFIGNGKGCKILGRDIGQGLVKLVNQMKADSLEMLDTELIAYCDREVTRLRREEKEARAQSIVDKVNCIQTIIGQVRDQTVAGLCQEIDRLFKAPEDGKELLTLSTIHKFKGLERDVIFIYRPDLMPSRWAKQDWEVGQETNLQYVAITRAKKALYYVA